MKRFLPEFCFDKNVLHTNATIAEKRIMVHRQTAIQKLVYLLGVSKSKKLFPQFLTLRKSGYKTENTAFND